jgi:hypothetical protein
MREGRRESSAPTPLPTNNNNSSNSKTQQQQQHIIPSRGPPFAVFCRCRELERPGPLAGAGDATVSVAPAVVVVAGTTAGAALYTEEAKQTLRLSPHHCVPTPLPPPCRPTRFRSARHCTFCSIRVTSAARLPLAFSPSSLQYFLKSGTFIDTRSSSSASEGIKAPTSSHNQCHFSYLIEQESEVGARQGARANARNSPSIMSAPDSVLTTTAANTGPSA